MIALDDTYERGFHSWVPKDTQKILVEVKQTKIASEKTWLDKKKLKLINTVNARSLKNCVDSKYIHKFVHLKIFWTQLKTLCCERQGHVPQGLIVLWSLNSTTILIYLPNQ